MKLEVLFSRRNNGMYRSSKRLLNQFCKAFLNSLQTEGVTKIKLHHPDTTRRLRKTFEELAKREDLTREEQRLVALLRPDPITGCVPVFYGVILQLQPSRVKVPNPVYDDASIHSPQVDDPLKSIAQAAAALFLQEKSPVNADLV
jgi:hypothetical protein